jgi:hypothetical protein
MTKDGIVYDRRQGQRDGSSGWNGAGRQNGEYRDGFTRGRAARAARAATSDATGYGANDCNPNRH